MTPIRKSRIVDEFGQPLELPVQRISAYNYDALNRRTDGDSWKYADSRSGDEVDSPYVRNRLTSLARFEYLNNSYCHGTVNKMAYETVGTGPRLEVEPDSQSKLAAQAANELEEIWQEHADETCFVDRLVTGEVEEIVGGEVFHMFRLNKGLSTVPVDFEQYEGIQFQSTAWHRALWDWDREYPIVDGMQMDRRGNVVNYHKLRQHPGSHQSGINFNGDVDEIPAEIVVHMFRKTRPSSYRGASQLAPCIELFNKLRRFTEATLETAENAASILGTVETAFQPNLCASGPGGPAEIPFGGGNLMTLPDGWKYNAYRPEQPTTNFDDYKRSILHEIISCLLIPWNVASGDSSDFNFASGQLDHRIFERVINFKRQRLEKRLINRFFKYWLEFAVVGGYIPARLGPFKWKWYWPSKEPIDPGKVANANRTLKEAGLLDETGYWQDRSMSYKDAIKREFLVKAYRVKIKAEVEEAMGVTIPEEEETVPQKPQEKPQQEPALEF